MDGELLRVVYHKLFSPDYSRSDIEHDLFVR